MFGLFYVIVFNCLKIIFDSFFVLGVGRIYYWGWYWVISRL